MISVTDSRFWWVAAVPDVVPLEESLEISFPYQLVGSLGQLFFASPWVCSVFMDSMIFWGPAGGDAEGRNNVFIFLG